jgi:hypothetical protein
MGLAKAGKHSCRRAGAGRRGVQLPGGLEITSKAEFFRLWNAGALGYRLRTWDSYLDLAASDNIPPIVGLRQIGAAGGGAFWVGSTSEVCGQISDWQAAGRRFMICEAAPDEKGTIQGEVCRGLRGWEGYLGLSTGLRMRDAMARGLLLPRSGATVLALLDLYMSAPSRDDLDALLDLYPDATVEFTCYGDHNFDRGRNTIYWEVRNY